MERRNLFSRSTVFTVEMEKDNNLLQTLLISLSSHFEKSQRHLRMYGTGECRQFEDRTLIYFLSERNVD